MKKIIFISIVLLMSTISGMAQLKCSLYKQTSYKTPEGKCIACTNDTYLMIKEGKTYEIQTYKVEGVSRVYAIEKDMKNIQANGKEINYTWTYDPSGYPGGQNTIKITNVYIPAKKVMSREMKTFLSLIKKISNKTSKKNKLFGVWQENDNSASLYYKSYNKKVRTTVRIAKVNNNNSILFTMEDVEYTKEGNTKEGGNPCTIKWQDNNTHILSYVYNGYTNSEKWSRTSLPSYVTEIFK
ncbi:MAG: hypothetical protein IKU79_02510 [Bacteroidaceae bacterium]|nr:hypothetical protein [Bacteroidaceae bacterium]